MNEQVLQRDRYVLSDWSLPADGKCGFCGAPCAGGFDSQAGSWGA